MRDPRAGTSGAMSKTLGRGATNLQGAPPGSDRGGVPTLRGADSGAGRPVTKAEERATAH
eukprot:6805933-Alexandrium_andersonii.AAC.1